jgi:O-antigen ligase
MVVDGRLTDLRFTVYDTIEHRILPRSGWWGIGPNTFSLIFPFFTNALKTPVFGFWAQAHQDYLQTLVEWGFFGTVLWFLFFSNSIVRAGAAFWRWKRTWDGWTRTLAVACFLAVGSVLVHAAVDFPMQIASLQLYTSVVLGLLASLHYTHPQRSRRFKTRLETGPLKQPGNDAVLDPKQ